MAGQPSLKVNGVAQQNHTVAIVGMSAPQEANRPEFPEKDLLWGLQNRSSLVISLQCYCVYLPVGESLLRTLGGMAINSEGRTPGRTHEETSA